MNKNAPTEQAYDLPTTLEDEACRLQSAVCRLPPEERGTVSAGPFSTD